MLAYKCRNCDQFTVFPLVNEFEEKFCTKECYEKFCKKHHYAIHLDRLRPLKISLSD